MSSPTHDSQLATPNSQVKTESRFIALASLRHGFVLRAVGSVWRRHARVYRQSWLVNGLSPITEPVLYLLGFGFGLAPLLKSIEYHGRVFTYQEFIAPGMVASGLLFQSSAEGAYGTYIRTKFQHTWQTMLTAPLHFNDVFAADLLWAATRGLFAALATMLVSLLFGILGIREIVFMFPAALLGCLTFAAFGMCSAALAKRIDHLNVPIFLIVMPMFTLCGTFFPRDNLPPMVRRFSELLPLSPLIDLLRDQNAPVLLLATRYGILTAWFLIFAAIAYRSLHRKMFR